MNPVLEHIPTPGLLTISPQFVSSVGAAVTCGLLGLLWACRRRAFILVWAAGWVSVSAAMFVFSDADPAGAIFPVRLAFAGSAAVSSSMLFLAGVLRYRRPVRWPALLVAPGVTFAVYAATSASCRRARCSR